MFSEQDYYSVLSGEKEFDISSEFHRKNAETQITLECVSGIEQGSASHFLKKPR